MADYEKSKFKQFNEVTNTIKLIFNNWLMNSGISESDFIDSFTTAPCQIETLHTDDNIKYGLFAADRLVGKCFILPSTGKGKLLENGFLDFTLLMIYIANLIDQRNNNQHCHTYMLNFLKNEAKDLNINLDMNTM